MFYIVYRTINRLNGKFYIGVHKSVSEDFDGYYGSGKLLRRAIKKYGKQYFKRYNLFIFNNPEDAFAEERRLLLDWLNHSDCYNIMPGGRGDYSHFLQKNIDRRAEKMSKVPRNKTWRENIRKSKMGVYDGDKNPRAKSWVVTAPNGASYDIRGRLHNFCKENNLIFSCLYGNQGTTVPKIQDGGYGGFREKYPGHRIKRENTTGWKLEGVM